MPSSVHSGAGHRVPQQRPLVPAMEQHQGPEQRPLVPTVEQHQGASAAPGASTEQPAVSLNIAL